MAAKEAELSQGRQVGAAAALLSASVLLSRVLGYAREVLLAHRAGAGAETDAYYAAFQIPDLLNYLLAGGALSIAFVPLYSKVLARGDVVAAERLLATVLGTVGTVALASVAALWWFAEPLVALQFPRFSPDTLALTVRLTRIVIPAQFFFVTGGIVNAALLARGRFAPSAVAPLLYNLGIIAGGLFLAPFTDSPVEGFSWGALAGAVAGPFVAPLVGARGRVRVRARVVFWDRGFASYLLLAAPLMFGQTLLTVDEWYERWFGALLGVGAVAHLSYARRLMLVPVAVVGQAIATAALPALSRLWAEGRTAELERVLLGTLHAGLTLAIAGAGAFFVLALPLTHLVYRHGAFTVADAAAVAGVLSVLAFGVPGWITQQIAVRAFYARGDTWRPMLLGTGVAAAAIPLYLWFGEFFGVRGLAAAGAIGMTVNAGGTLWLAHRLHGGPDLSRLLPTGVRTLAITLGAVVVTRGVVGGAGAHGVTDAALQLVSGFALFVGVLLAGVWVFGDDVMRSAFRRMLHSR